MADPELQKIRNERLAQLQSQFNNEGGDSQAQRVKQEQAQAQEDEKNSILSQILTQEARARLNTLHVAKPEKTRRVEAMLLNMARGGRIGKKLDESDLISILENVNATIQSKTSVKFDRRRAAIDSDDDI